MSPVRTLAAFALILAVSAHLVTAAERRDVNLVAGSGTFTIDPVAGRPNVFIFSNVADVALTISVGQTVYPTERATADRPYVSLSLGGILSCNGDWTDTITVSYETAVGGIASILISNPELELQGRKSDFEDYEIPDCAFTSSNQMLRDVFIAIKDVEQDAHFRVKLLGSEVRLRNTYADDGVCPGTDCPQKNDFTKDRCPFAAREEGTSNTHEINSLWSPSGVWWFRVQPEITMCLNSTVRTISLNYSDAFTAKVSAALVAVLAVAAMLF